MSLEQKIMAELKPAMLAKDEKTVRSLRAVKAAIIVAKTAEGASGELSADEEIKLLQKLVKQRKDSLDIFTKQNRPDLAAKEQDNAEYYCLKKEIEKNSTYFVRWTKHHRFSGFLKQAPTKAKKCDHQHKHQYKRNHGQPLR